MPAMILRGELVVLRPADASDLDAFIAIFEAPGIDEWWPGDDRAALARELLEDEDVTAYAVEVDDQVVGLVQSYEETDPLYRHAGIDIALHPSAHGRGIG